MNPKVVMCCAKDCQAVLTSDCYRFPKEPELVREYLSILEREDLLSLSIDQLRDNYLFCPLHVDVVPDEPCFVVVEEEGEDVEAQEPVRNTSRQPLVNVQYQNIPLDYRREAPETILNFSELACPLCGKGFCSPYTLRNHMLNYHRIPGENILQVTSPSVSASACSRSNLDSSTSSTSQETNPIPNSKWKCTFCDKVFPDIDKYRKHMLKCHRDFFCENCDKSFKTAGYFRKHKKLHCKRKAMKRSS